MVIKEIILEESDFKQFRSWIDLNLEALTWQGRNEEQFEEFWSLFFINGLSLEQMMSRFHYAYVKGEIGPLISWFNWLKEKFLSFVFISKDISLYELAKVSNYPVSEVATILRNFFIEVFPHKDEYFNTRFQVGNISSENLYISYDEVKKDLDIKMDIKSSNPDDVMPSMEVTLYKEWDIFLSKMKKDLYNPTLNLKKIRSNASLKKQLFFVGEIFALLLLGILFIYGVKVGNEWYEKYLTSKIRIYEPQFLWLDKSLKFKPKAAGMAAEDLKLKVKNLEEIATADEEEVFYDEEERYDPESEVILTSWDALPRDFDVADLEQSEFEEQKKGGYRDTRYGNKKVYRVMMKSDQPNLSKDKLNILLDRYRVTQVDQVKPGTAVPGGSYYNLHVPLKYLKEFLAQVMEVDDAILFESRTRTRNPPGKTKVFVWIKEI